MCAAHFWEPAKACAAAYFPAALSARRLQVVSLQVCKAQQRAHEGLFTRTITLDGPGVRGGKFHGAILYAAMLEGLICN